MRTRITPGAMWWEGFRCGLLNLLRFPRGPVCRASLRLLLCPVDLWRYHEFAAVLDAYPGEGAALDVASPKLLALILARRRNVAVTATDLAARALAESVIYPRAAPADRIQIRELDATAMRDLPDASYPFVYSVSALEHFAGDGDTRAVREIARVLMPGGRAVLTVPVAPKAEEVWLDHDPYGRQHRDPSGKVFFCRIYDWQALCERIAEPSGLRLAEVRAWQEVHPGWYRRYIRRTAVPASPGAVFTKLLDPYWAFACIRPVDGMPPEISGRGIAALTLEKAFAAFKM